MKRILAITAVLFLLLRPVCDVWAASHGHAGYGAAAHAAAVADDHSAHGQSSEFCCDKVQDGNLIAAGAVGLASAVFDGWFLESISSIPVARGHRLQPRVWHSLDAPPTKLSYYARSARILR